MLIKGQWVVDYMRLLWWEHPSFSHKTLLLAKVLNTCCLLTHALCSPAGFEWHDITKTHESVVTNSQYWKISLRPHFVTILFQFIISFLFSLTLSGRIGRRGKGDKRIVCDAMNTYVNIISWYQGISHICVQISGSMWEEWIVIIVTKCGPCLPFIYLCVHFHISLLPLLQEKHIAPLCQ